jgi:translation initiation factor IF-2
MSEWLGRPKLEEKDIKEFQPSIVKHYPFTVKYFVENQKPRVVLAMPYDTFDRLKKVMERKGKKVTPPNVRKIVFDALEEWIKENEKGKVEKKVSKNVRRVKKSKGRAKKSRR